MDAYSTDDRCFYPDAPGLSPISDRVSKSQNAYQLVIRGAEGEHDWTNFVVAWRGAAVVADRCISIRWDIPIICEHSTSLDAAEAFAMARAKLS